MSDAPFDLVDARDSFMDTDWFHACKKSQTPYVVIRSGETTADVLWDFVTLPPSCDLKIRSSFLDIEREVRAIFDRFAVADSYLRIRPTLICFDRLPLDQAKRAATELYGLIASYLPPTRQASLASTQQPILPTRVKNINRGPHSGSGRRLWVEDNDPSSSAA